MAAKLLSLNYIQRKAIEASDDENKEEDYEADDEEEEDDEEEDYDGLKEFQPLIDEINKLQETSGIPYVQHPEQPEENSAANNVVEDFSKKLEALNDGSDRWCADCSKARRVEDMRSLQRGQHISLPGERSSYFFKSLGKRISAYQHHAIVKEIVQRSRQTAEVILIHFSKEDNVIKVREQRRTFNLQNDELYMIEYQYPRYDSDTIVQRAESILEQSGNGELFKSYNPFTKNCEHFAIWCVVGEKKSLQAHTFINDIKQMLWSIFGDGSKIARLILKLFINSSDEITSFFTKAINLPSVALGLNSTAYIIYCIIKTVYLIKQYKKEKKLCWHCFKEKLLDLWLQLGVFGVTSVIIFVILNFALPMLWPSAAISIAVLLALVATALTLAVPRIRKALWSPVRYREKEIKTLSEMKVGDVASLSYYGLSHHVVVSEVKWDDNPEKGTVIGIHYSLPGLLGTRVIIEEEFKIDLRRSKVNLIEFNTLCTYSPGQVVERAMKRVGERKWNMSSNKSNNFCQWAKVKFEHEFEETNYSENETSGIKQSGRLSSLLVGKADVHLMNEIQPGDVVEYRSYKGIVIQLENVKYGREFLMHIVIRHSWFKYYGKKVTLRIDLNKDSLVVHRYHPVHCVSMSERVENAIGTIGKKIQSWTRTGFIMDIILKQRENN